MRQLMGAFQAAPVGEHSANDRCDTVALDGLIAPTQGLSGWAGTQGATLRVGAVGRIVEAVDMHQRINFPRSNREPSAREVDDCRIVEVFTRRDDRIRSRYGQQAKSDAIRLIFGCLITHKYIVQDEFGA